MLDFLIISTRPTRNGIEIYPNWRMYPKSKDLMIRGGDFYAVWVEELGLWSTNEDDVFKLVDRELDRYVNEHTDKFDGHPRILYMWDSQSGMVDSFHKYCQKQMRDSYEVLDEELIFSNTETKRENYASKKLEYPLEVGSITAYDKLIGTLYSPEERHKLEWAIGAIVSGDSRYIQKFMVLYGAAGTGKSTILNIIQKLFNGYYAVFDAKALGSSNNRFALGAFSNNPLVAIQHDGDLSRIEDNTILNSLVSHEEMPVDEKFKRPYVTRFKCFLFMGTNKHVKITDGKSGLLRRLIDVSPTGNKVSPEEYERLIGQVDFELGAIAQHCLDVYNDDPDFYDDYIPTSMIEASNDFHNFIIDSYDVFKKEDGTTLKAAWEMYKTYCEEARVPYPFSKRNFQEELKNYFKNFDRTYEDENGNTLRQYYSVFNMKLLREFEKEVVYSDKKEEPKQIEKKKSWLEFNCTTSLFDEEYKDCPAQYANSAGTPNKKWEDVKTTLGMLDTSKVHYVKVPEVHIVADFDLKDETGEKSFELNYEAASKWPATYAELSKSGAGIHLHYIYTGDVSQLSRIYDDDIEIKVFTGGSSLRRRLSKCNDIPIATISSGLPLKEVKGNMMNFDGIQSEKALRTLLKRHLNKEIMGFTKPSVDMIYKILNEAYESGVGYDVSDLQDAVYALAMSSSNQANACIKMVNQMKFKSEEANETINDSGDDRLIFYDVEVFPNLFLVNWKVQGEGKKVVRMINPKPHEIEELIKHKLVGFNNLNYDNHMIYGCLMGYSNEELYRLSQRLVSNDKELQRNSKFSEAYNLSYTDVYDFSAKKQSLKKWEIELGIKHHELGLDWDKPVPEEMWEKVAEYCDSDVVATEAVFNNRHADWVTRQILAKLSGLTVNETNRRHINRYIFGTNRKPELLYTDLATGEQFPGR